MTIINDGDRFVVQHPGDGNTYTYTGSNLKADIRSVIGSNGVSKINAGQAVVLNPTSGVGNVTISAEPTLQQVIDKNATTRTKAIFKAGVDLGDGAGTFTLAADGNATVRNNIFLPGSSKIDNFGAFFCKRNTLLDVNTQGSGTYKNVYMRESDGLLMFGPGDVIVKTRSSEDSDELDTVVVPENTDYPNLVELVNNLKARIEQLEADHASAMGNTQTNGGY